MHLGVAQLGGLDLIGGLRRQLFGQVAAPTPPAALDNTEQIRQAKLAALKNEKQKFIEGLFIALSTGKPIKMSEFFLKRDLLDENIPALEKGNGQMLGESFLKNDLGEIFKLVDRSTKAVSGPDQIADRTHQTLFTKYLRAYVLKSSDLADVLTDGTFNCDSSTQLKIVLMERVLDPNKFGVILFDPPVGRGDGHILSWYQSVSGLWQIENTDGGRPYRTPYVNGLRLPSDVYVVSYLLNNGIELKQLPGRFAEYYKHGMTVNKWPIAGVSHDLPPPPDFLPNNYYYESSAGILGKAELTKTADDLFLSESDPVGRYEAPVQVVKLYPGVDWCVEANREISSISGTENQTYFNHNLFDGRKKMFRYRAAIMMADLGVKSGAYNGERCLPSAEFAAFRRQAELIISHKADSWGNLRRKAMADLKRARPFLTKIFNDTTIKRQVRVQAYNVLMVINDPADFKLFASEYASDSNKFHSTDDEETMSYKYSMRFSAIAYFGNQQGEFRKEAGELLFSSLKEPPLAITTTLTNYNYQEILFEMSAYNLIKLGRGAEVLPYYKARSGMAEGYKLQILDGLLDFSSKQDPPIDQAAIEEQVNRPEEGPAAKVYWIALLAKSGELSKAEAYLEKFKIWEYLLSPNDPLGIKGNVILTLRSISSPKIKPLLLRVLANRPEFAVEIADVFQQTGQLHEPLISTLRGIFNNESLDQKRREYAAYVLLRYGRL